MRYCGWADLIVSDHKIDSLAKELPTVTEIHRGLPLALPGRWPLLRDAGHCFVMLAIALRDGVTWGSGESATREEIHVSLLAVYPLSK